MSEGSGSETPTPEGPLQARLSRLERRLTELERAVAGLKAESSATTKGVTAGPGESTPTHDLDSLSTLLGHVKFKGSGSLADVTVDIPPAGQDEDPGSDFILWGQAAGRDWEKLDNSANRPVRLHGHGKYRDNKNYKVKVTFERGGPGSRRQTKLAKKGKTKSLELT